MSFIKKLMGGIVNLETLSQFETCDDVESFRKILEENPHDIHILCPSCKQLKKYTNIRNLNYLDPKYKLVCRDCTKASASFEHECKKCTEFVEKVKSGNLPCYKAESANRRFILCFEKHFKETYHSGLQPILPYRYYYNLIDSSRISINQVPKEYLTLRIIKLAKKRDPCCELFFEKQTNEMCEQFVQTCGYALKYVHIQTETICRLAVENDSFALEFVDSTILTADEYKNICLIAVRNCGYTLEYVKNQTKEICLTAVKQNGWALQYVNRDISTHEDYSEICLEAIKYSERILSLIAHQTDEMCLVAVRNSPYALDYVKKQTEEICLEAIKKDPYAIRYVKIEFVSWRLIRCLIIKNLEKHRLLNHVIRFLYK